MAQASLTFGKEKAPSVGALKGFGMFGTEERLCRFDQPTMTTKDRSQGINTRHLLHFGPKVARMFYILPPADQSSWSFEKDHGTWNAAP